MQYSKEESPRIIRVNKSKKIVNKIPFFILSIICDKSIMERVALPIILLLAFCVAIDKTDSNPYMVLNSILAINILYLKRSI
jgi:hypothetical protein